MTFPFEALTSLSGTNITAKISLQLRFQGSFTVLWFGGQCLLLSASSFEQLPQLIQINAAFIWLQLCLPTFKFVCGGKTPSTTFQNMNWKLGARCEQLQSHHSEDTHSCGWPSAPASSWQTPSPGSSGQWCWLWPGGTPLLVLSVLCGDSGPELAGLPVGSWEMTEASNMDSMRYVQETAAVDLSSAPTQSLSKMMTVSAAVRLIPSPPARVLNRKMNTSGSLENLAIFQRPRTTRMTQQSTRRGSLGAKHLWSWENIAPSS